MSVNKVYEKKCPATLQWESSLRRVYEYSGNRSLFFKLK